MDRERDILTKAALAEQAVRDAKRLLEEAAQIALQNKDYPMQGSLSMYASTLGEILIADSGATGLESLVRKLGGI